MGYVLGIDPGTTYTSVATYRDGRAQIVSIGTRTAAAPSVVVVEGQTAVEFKRRIGDDSPVMVGESAYSASQLLAELLRAVVERVAQLEGEPPDHIAVCHPANWGPSKRELLDQAAAAADIGSPTFVSDTEAAAVHFASTEPVESGEIVAVYDLGGGTFDAAVLRKTEAGFETLGEPQGVERLGGIDFDAALVAHVRDAVGGARVDPELDRVRERCIAAKEALSSDREATIAVELGTGATEVRLTRSDFEAMIEPLLSDSIEALYRALRSAHVKPSDLRSVLLVGGSSRIPLVAEMVSAELGRPVAVHPHPKHAIALGAAIVASAAAEAWSTADTATAASVVVTPEPSASRLDVILAGPGWIPDPTGRHEYRYWDGAAWTDKVSDRGTAAVDPIPATK